MNILEPYMKVAQMSKTNLTCVFVVGTHAKRLDLTKTELADILNAAMLQTSLQYRQ